MQRKMAKEAAEKELEDFIQRLKASRAAAATSKPPKGSWKDDDRTWFKIESLEAYALDACKSDDQKKTAGTVMFLICSS